MDDEARILSRMTDSGFRITTPRRDVVRAVCRREESFSADDLYDELRTVDSGVGRATVFRTLDVLVGLRLLDRVHRPDGSHCYVNASPGHRHHLICSECGTVIEFHDCNVDDLVASLSTRTHFRIESHWLELYGTCERCQVTAS
jgi:Fur family transcriptional regulator, ferric uptake regulator